MVPGVDKFDSLVEIVDGDDGQNRCKDFTGRKAAIRTTNSRLAPNHVHALAHQRIVGSNVPDNRRSNIFRLTIDVSTKDDSSLGVVQQSLDSVKASIIWETGDVTGLGSAIRIEF